MDDVKAKVDDVLTDHDRFREALERITSPRSGHLQRDALRRIAREALDADE